MHRWTPNPVPDEIAFEAIKTGVDSMPPDVKMILNSGMSNDANPSNRLKLIAMGCPCSRILRTGLRHCQP